MTRKRFPTKPQLMARAVARCATDVFFMAWALERYRSAEGWDEQQLAAYLECTAEQLTRLALCRRPLASSERFVRDVQAIAAYTGANPFRLAELLRAVEALNAFAVDRPVAAPEQGLLAAARDRQEGEHTDSPPVPPAPAVESDQT